MISSPRKGAAEDPLGQGKVSHEGFSKVKVSRGGSRAESALRKGEKKVRTGQQQLWEEGKEKSKRQRLNLAKGQVPARGCKYQQSWEKEVLG